MSMGLATLVILKLAGFSLASAHPWFSALVVLIAQIEKDPKTLHLLILH